MTLVDREIVEALVKKTLVIEPFTKENLTPNGYDLTIAELKLPSSDEHIKSGTLKVPGMTWFLVSTKEYMKLHTLAGSLWIRTSFARKGVMPSFGKVDVGFEGTLTLSAFNAGPALELQVGTRFAQIVFERTLAGPELLYAQRSGNYMGQKGITL